ncbi:hypothetical protein JW848_02070 [Candidatus Bipolaricaulota bacterium]|nr:hypothetical protein [Candidatus Bipolaricaulota bacterium]
MNTNDIMALAVEMAGFAGGEVPGDSAIYHAARAVKQVLVGVDIGPAELLLARDLGVDLAIAHHPMGGQAKLRFHEVLWRHADQMIGQGVPAETARQIVGPWAERQRIEASMRNVDHAPSIARLLGLGYMNIHTPLDEIGRRRMAEAIAAAGAEISAEALAVFLKDRFAEFRNAATEIEVRLGDPKRRIGRTVVSHGAGTNGGYQVAKAYFDHGIDTLIYIHCSPGDVSQLKEVYGDRRTLIVTGHIASDSLGINPFLQALTERGLDVRTFSGIIPATV